VKISAAGQAEYTARDAARVDAPVVVIGAGFGGLASAIRLQAAGHTVTVLEARDIVGGRASQIRDGGYTFDTGPTLITAPELLRDLWATAGRRLEDDVDLRPLSPYYRILFQNGRTFDYWGAGAREDAEIARFNPIDVDGYRRFLAASGRIYERAFADLGRKPFLTLGSFARVVPELVRLGGLRSVHGMVARYIADEDLRSVFSFHPLFIGGNPFRASAIYSIVPYLERLSGVHFAMGGTYSLISAMARLFEDLGGKIAGRTRVTRIQTVRGRVSGVETAGGVVHPARFVVANSDVATTLLDLVDASVGLRADRFRLRRGRYSMSCFLLYLGVRRQYPQLHHHTIVMPRDYRQHITDIFDGTGLPDDLALYLHTPTRSDPSMAPEGCESIYVLSPVPHLGREIDWTIEGDRYRDRIIEFLERELGLERLSKSIEVEHRFTPLDFRDQLGSYLGSAFSLEPTLAQSAYLRPHNRAGRPRGLYLAGAGTHPGAGIPGVLLSAEITSRLVLEDGPVKRGSAEHRTLDVTRAAD
jgi:phytoene desaturase